MFFPLPAESYRMVELWRKAKAEWTSEGNQKWKFPEYVRRSRALRNQMPAYVGMR